MGQKSSEETLNLGQYTIIEDDPEDFRNGAFYRRRRNDSESADQDGNNNSPPPSQPAKRQAISSGAADRPARRSLATRAVPNITPPPSSSEQDKLTSSSKSIELTQWDSALRTPPPESEIPTQIATQPVDDNETIIATQPISVHDDSSENLVVNIDPFRLEDEETDDDDTNLTNNATSDLSGIRGSQFASHEGPVIWPIRRKVLRRKRYPKKLPYDRIMADVIFVMSGYENPRRAKLRDMAIAMGAKYQSKWTRFCTHLICAFKHTPKYKEVMAENGRIVREHWIQECSKQRKLLDWRKYKLGQYNFPDSEEEIDADDD